MPPRPLLFSLVKIKYTLEDPRPRYCPRIYAECAIERIGVIKLVVEMNRTKEMRDSLLYYRRVYILFIGRPLLQTAINVIVGLSRINGSEVTQHGKQIRAELIRLIITNCLDSRPGKTSPPVNQRLS